VEHELEAGEITQHTISLSRASERAPLFSLCSKSQALLCFARADEAEAACVFVHSFHISCRISHFFTHKGRDLLIQALEMEPEKSNCAPAFTKKC